MYPRSLEPTGHEEPAERGRRSENRVMYTFRVDPETFDELLQICRKENVIMSELVRDLIRYGIDHYE